MRVWVISFCIVAVLTGGYLWMTRDTGGNGSDTGNNGVRPVPQELDIESVEAYLKIEQELDRERLEALQTGKPEEIDERTYAVLQKNGHSKTSWNELRRRVEEVVVALRLEAKAPKERAELEQRIRMKREAADAATGALQKTLRKEAEMLEQLRDNSVIRLNENDREIAMRYWRDLDRVVPRLNPTGG